MTEERLTRWTCDVCGDTYETNGYAPVGWRHYRLHFIETTRGSEHAHDVCPSCAEAISRFVDSLCPGTPRENKGRTVA